MTIRRRIRPCSLAAPRSPQDHAWPRGPHTSRNCHAERDPTPTRARRKGAANPSRIVARNGRAWSTAPPKHPVLIGRRTRTRRRAPVSRPWTMAMNRRARARPRGRRQFKRRRVAIEAVRFETIQHHLRRRPVVRVLGKADHRGKPGAAGQTDACEAVDENTAWPLTQPNCWKIRPPRRCAFKETEAPDRGPTSLEIPTSGSSTAPLGLRHLSRDCRSRKPEWRAREFDPSRPR
jgi:hypothetical protein